MKKKKKKVVKREGFTYEDERWIIVEDASLYGDGWTCKREYSFRDNGTFVRLTLTTNEGKKYRYDWNRTSITKEKLEERCQVLKSTIKKVVRRQPKKVGTI